MRFKVGAESAMNELTRVLFVNHSGQMGGAEFSLEGLVTHLPVKSCVVVLSSGPLMERLKDKGIPVLMPAGSEELVSPGRDIKLLPRLWSARRLPGLVRQLAQQASEYDLIYVNSKKALLFALPAAWLLAKPLIWHQRDEMQKSSVLPLRHRLSEGLLVWLLNRYASRIISVSQAAADSFIMAGGRAELPVVIHNGLDPAQYTIVVDRNSVRVAAGLPLDRRVIGCFGRLTAWKGQAVLIEALASVPDTHVVMVGGAIFGETVYEASLHALAKRLGLAGRVHFLGHRDDLPALMQAVDIVAHPSTQFDPCPRVVLEALHSSVPLIATTVGGTPELVENGVSGLLVPPSDPQALAAAILELLNDRALGVRLAVEGCHQASERFTFNRVVTLVEHEINAMVAK